MRKINSTKKVAVIGLGGFGENLVKFLSEKKNIEIIAIDIDPVLVNRIKDFASRSISMDATVKENLAAAGIAEVDYAVVSSGPGLESSIITVHALKELGVPHIIAKALNSEHEKILHLVGAAGVVFPERDSAEKVGNQIHIPNLIDYIPLPSGYVIQEIKPSDSFVGKTLREIDLRKKFNVTVLAIKSVSPHKNTINPSAEAKVRENDVLIVFGEVNDIETLDETMNHS
ncbi:MAG: trk/ktr system potassium uptake protein [Acidobacteriota bacterium]|nr:trk/ktr system potassium uptake protein [Acidobacteriota bacterium]